MLVIIIIILVIALVWQYKYINKLNEKIKKQQSKFQSLISQKKSSEVRVGKIGENLAPFLKEYPYDPNRFRFLGNPVDGIQFADDEVIFVEMKTGRSRLSKTQQKIKELVIARKVSFATFRMGEDGCEFRKENPGG